MADDSEDLSAIGKMVHAVLYDVAEHACDFVLLALPKGRADWIVSHSYEGVAPFVMLYRQWLARFLEDGPKVRQAEPDEIAVAGVMRDLGELISTALKDMTGEDRFALLVFARDQGSYCANISRDSAKLVMVELLQHLERRQ